MRPDRIFLGWLLLLGLVGFGAAWDALDSVRRPAATWCAQSREGAETLATAVMGGDLGGIGPAILALFVEPTAHAWWHARSFVVIGALVVGALIAMLGTAVIRIDVARLAFDRDLALVTALKDSARTWRRAYGTLILAPVLAIVLLSPVVVVGMVAAIPGISAVLSLLWGVLLVPAFAAALVLFGWLVSLAILPGAMALESGDPVENVIRSFIIVRQRTVRFLLMILAAAIALVVGWLVVSGVLVMTLRALNAASGFVFGSTPAGPTVTWPGLASVWAEETGPRGWSDSVVGWWFCFAISLAWAWVIAVGLQFSGRMYLVLRRAVERLPLDEIDEFDAR